MGFISFTLCFLITFGLFGVITWLYYSIPKTNNTWFILDELKYTFKINLFHWIIFLFNVFLIDSTASNIHILSKHPSLDDNIPYLLLLFGSLFAILADILLLLANTKFIANKIKDPTNYLLLSQYDENLEIYITNDMIFNDDFINNTNNNNNNDNISTTINDKNLNSIDDILKVIKLDHIILNEQAMKYFIEHLFQDRCIEILVSLIEMLMLKQYIQRECKRALSVHPDKSIWMLYVSELPVSDLIYDATNNNDNSNDNNNKIINTKNEAESIKDVEMDDTMIIIKKIILAIYNKYISPTSAQYTIQINKKLKLNYINLCKNTDIFIEMNLNTYDELFCFYNDIENEIISHLKFEMLRFKYKNEFKYALQSIKQIFTQNINQYISQMKSNSKS